MYNCNKSQNSPFDLKKFANCSVMRTDADLISKCGHRFKKTVSFHDIVQFIDEENIVTYLSFDCGITFYREAPTKVERINRS